MAKRRVVAHVLKTAERAGQVAFVSVAFDGPGLLVPGVSRQFRDRLAGGLTAFVHVEVHSRPGRSDWFLHFLGVCPEAKLDEQLKLTANELRVPVFIEPAIPLQEMGIDPRDFLFEIDLSRDKPSNED